MLSKHHRVRYKLGEKFNKPYSDVSRREYRLLLVIFKLNNTRNENSARITIKSK